MKVMCVIILLLLLTLLTTTTACSNTKVPVNDNTNTEQITLNKEDETIYFDSSDQLEMDTETSTTEEVYDTIKENPFTVKLRYKDDTHTFFYTAPKDGFYRFDMYTDNVDTSYKLMIYDSTNKELCYVILHEGESTDGANIMLKKGEKYKIVIQQSEGFALAKIKIGIPNDIFHIDNDNISGEISYIGQENTYKFRSTNAGYYQFDFDINNIEAEYRVTLKDDINQEIFDSWSGNSNRGHCAQLAENKEYTLYVKYKNELPKYSITIHRPQAAQNIVGNSFSGQISYLNQHNVYYYVPSSSGTYLINIYTDNIDANCYVTLKNSKNEILIDKISEFTAKVELQAGEQYTFSIAQNNEFLKYDISINKAK